MRRRRPAATVADVHPPPPPRFRWPRALGAVALATLAACAGVERAAEPAPAAPASWQPAAATGSAAATGHPAPAPSDPSLQHGRVSYYGPGFAGRQTASGQVFDADAMTVAHRELPFGTKVRVTNLRNQRSVVVTVNDRGPFVAGRIADLSEGAARRLGMVNDGVVEARLEVLARPGGDGE